MLTWIQAAADRLAPESPWREDPVGWVHEVAGDETWSGQREILNALVQHKRIAVKAAHSLGKSFAAGRAAVWWLEAHGLDRSFVLTTAPTFNQVRAILWKEIKRTHDKSGARGTLNQTEIWHDREIVALGRKPADWDPDSFQGIHAEHVLVIIDEASGVPRVLWDAADSLASNDGSCILAVGNPTNPSSFFREACDSPEWHTIRLDGLASPNFTSERVSAGLGRVLMSRTWAESKARSWGTTSPLYLARVRGEFPEDAEDGVVPYSWVSACTETDLEPGSEVELGVDVGGGGDLTVVVARCGPVVTGIWTNNSDDPDKVVQKIVKVAGETGAARVKIDSIGIGWGIMGSVRKELRGRAKVFGVNVSEASTKPSRFKNLRAQVWWEVGRELSQNRGWDLAELPEDVLDQLTKPTYSVDSAGRIVVESKDDIRKRIGRSPDEADALLLAFYVPGKGRRSVRAKSA